MPRERWHDSRVGYEKMQVHAHKRAEMWYHIRRQFKNRCVRRIGWHCWNLRNFIVCAKRSRECTRPGACLSRGPHRAFSGPQQEHGRRVRPLSSPVIGKRALEERVARIGTAARSNTQRALNLLRECALPSRPLRLPIFPSRPLERTPLLKTATLSHSRPAEPLAPSSACRQSTKGKQGKQE